MMKTLLLVDGSSYLYRAYHAMPNLRNAKGEPTGALYGVVNMLRRILLDYSPDYLACIFDARGKTFRDALYADYKANRASMPEDLALQIDPIHDMVKALGWPVYAIEGVEADDVIGTLVTQAAQAGVKSIVSTGDKDLAQLVNDHVTLINTMSGEVLDNDGVVSKFGVPPERIIDFLMLTGDKVDNIPGVPKVGDKTAAKWIQQYGSLDGIVENAQGIKGVVGQNLRDTLDQFPLTRTLVTVKTDCDLSPHIPSLDRLAFQGQDQDRLIALADQHGLKTLLREVSGDEQRIPRGDGKKAEALADLPVLSEEEVRYHCVNTEADLAQLLEALRAAKIVALDTETTSLNAMEARLVGLSFAIEATEAWYVPVAHQQLDPVQLSKDTVLQALKPWLEDAQADKVLHNAKYDTHVLANEGVSLQGICHDTMLQGYVLESHRAVGMSDMALRWLGRKGTSYEDICGKGAKQIGFDEVPIEVATHYACEDADFTLRLHEVLYPKIQENDKLNTIYNIELPASRVLTIMERNGAGIDVAVLAKQSQDLGQQMQALEQQAYALAEQPFNLNSPKQLGEILFGKLGLPIVKKTASGAPSTDEEVLSKLALDYPLPKALISYRGLAKLKSTYTDKLPKMVNPKTGRVHTNYAQAAVVTGRLASSDPNLQNIPVRTEEGRRIREAFIAAPGHRLVSADYSQIELRIMAHISEDESLLAAFSQGLDVHRATAAEIFSTTPDAVNAEQRRIAKVINFGLIYGMSAFGLASNLGIERAAAQHYIDRYFARYPGVARYMDETRIKAREQGFVETVFGRRLWLPEITGGSGPRRQAAERAAINAPMQGTAADLIKLAMVAVQTWLEEKQLGAKQIMQVHDELVLEVPESELAQVREHLPALMCAVAQLKVPLVAEVGEGVNWEQAH